MRSLIFDVTKILLLEHFQLEYFYIAEVIHYRSFYRIEFEPVVFKLRPILFMWSFSKSSLSGYGGITLNNRAPRKASFSYRVISCFVFKIARRR